MLSIVFMGQATLKTKGRVRCDNRSLVDAITKGSSKENILIHLLRSLRFFTAVFDIDITTSHIPGVQIIGDSGFSLQYLILISPHLTSLVYKLQLQISYPETNRRDFQ